MPRTRENHQFGDMSVTPNYKPRWGFQVVKQLWFGRVRFLSDRYRAEKGGLICRSLKTDGAGKACTRLAWEAQQSFHSNPVESVRGNEPMDIKELWVKLQVGTANTVSYLLLSMGQHAQRISIPPVRLGTEGFGVWDLGFLGFLYGVGFVFSLLLLLSRILYFPNITETEFWSSVVNTSMYLCMCVWGNLSQNREQKETSKKRKRELNCQPDFSCFLVSSFLMLC